MADLSGTDIDRYHIIEPLGQGGMAIVYKAFDTRLDREVAIKFIRRNAFSPDSLERVLKRFDREAKSLAKLTHPNIVSVIDYGEFEGSPYLVMPFLKGGTVKQFLGKPMPWKRAFGLLAPVADALDFAHQKGIVHRDVKPGNILITEGGQPMLTDFGIAHLLENEEGETLTSTGVGVGTPEYMSPEQAMGRKVDNRSDTYSLGVVLFELVTGKKPYEADTPMAVAIKQTTEPLPTPSTINADLPEIVDKVIFKALMKDPQDRYQTMADFEQALMDFGFDGMTSGKSEVQSVAPTQDYETYATVDQIDYPVVTEEKELLPYQDNGETFGTVDEGAQVYPDHHTEEGEHQPDSVQTQFGSSETIHPPVALKIPNPILEIPIQSLPVKKKNRNMPWLFLGLVAALILFFLIVLRPRPAAYVDYTQVPQGPVSTLDPNAVVQKVTLVSLSQDGEISNSDFSSWEDSRVNNSITWNDLSGGTVGASIYASNKRFIINRVALFFDTSKLPANATIVNVTLTFTAGEYVENDSSFEVLPITDPSGGFPYPSENNVTWNTLGGKSMVLANAVTQVELGSGDYSWINRNGITGLEILHHLDYVDQVPTQVNSFIMALSEDPNPTGPYLLIEYIVN